MNKKFNNLVVPKDKCPIDFIAEIDGRIRNSVTLVHRNVIEKLEKSEGAIPEEGEDDCRIITWEATEEYSKTTIIYRCFEYTRWYTILYIDAEDIDYKDVQYISDPDAIYLLRMAE